MSAELEHPVWCDPERCTAPRQPPADYDPEVYGAHRSDLVVGSWGGLAYLTQAFAPWETSVYLRLEHPGTGVDSYALDAASPLLLLLRQYIAEQQSRYPLLMPPLDMAPRQHPR